MIGRDGSLAGRARGLDHLILLGLLVAAGLLVAGLFLPLMRVTTFVLFSGTVSLITVVQQLSDSGETVLAVLLFFFSVVTPLIKLIVASVAWTWFVAGGPRLHRYVRAIEAIGRWSMLDVFVVALLVVTMKVPLVSDVTVLPGIYFFGAAVLLTQVISLRIGVLARRAEVAAKIAR